MILSITIITTVVLVFVGAMENIDEEFRCSQRQGWFRFSVLIDLTDV